MMGLEYAVVMKKQLTITVPTCPTCPAVLQRVRPREETFQQISEAIVFHLEGLKEDGLPIPEPESSAAVVRV